MGEIIENLHEPTEPNVYFSVGGHGDEELSGVASWEWTWDRSLKSIILTPIVLFTILGNFLVLYTFVTRKRDLRSPTHIFIANLSLADFLVGVMAMPFLATLHVTDRWYFGLGFCHAWVIIHFWLCSASILSTCAVCIERYVGVKYPLEHLNIMSRQRVGAMILAVWALAGSLTLTSVYAWPETAVSKEEFGCIINGQLGHVIMATVGILYIPAIVMMVLYWRIFVIATEHLKALKKKNGGAGCTYSAIEAEKGSSTSTTGINISTSDDLGKGEPVSSSGNESRDNAGKMEKGKVVKSKERASSKEINLAKRLAVLVGVLLFSYIPFFTLFLIKAVHPELNNSSGVEVLFRTLGWIRYFNSCINPVIYAFAVPAYKKAFNNVLFKGKL